MVFFWYWVVRLPFGVAAVACLLGGVASVVEWSVSLMGLAVFAVIADAAQHLGDHARRRSRERLVVEQEVAEARLMRGRFSEQKPSGTTRAA